MTIRIEITHTFPVPVSEGFSFVTEMSNWPEYWPGFVHVDDATNARWGQPGDRVTVVLRLLGREREMNMELESFETDRLVTYRSSQRGLPDARHERHFASHSEGFEYRVVVEAEPRSGLAGLFDRLVIERAVTRAMHKTIDNLDRTFQQSDGQTQR